MSEGQRAASWQRAQGEELDDAYFLDMLEPDDLSAMWQKEGDIVVWTREYVRSQVGAPLLDVGLVKAREGVSHGRPQPAPARVAAPTLEDAPVEISTEHPPIVRSVVRAHRCPECHSLNESAKFSRRSGGTTCQVCGRFDVLPPDTFSDSSAAPPSAPSLPERRVPLAAEPQPGRSRPMASSLLQLPAGTAALRAPLVAQVRLCASRPAPDQNCDDETWRPAVDAVEKWSMPGCFTMKSLTVLLMICIVGMAVGLVHCCRLPTSVQLWSFPPLFSLDATCAPVPPEGPLARWRTRLRSVFSRVKK